MANKASPYPLNYSIKYQTGNSQVRQAQLKPKPRMLAITSVPDDHKVTLDYYDRRNGFEFKIPGGFDLPEFSEFEREDIVLGGRKGGIPQVPIPDFAINRISDPDTNQNGLALAMRFVAENNIPVLNHPEKILATRRDVFYQRFSNNDGIVIPKTIRVTPKYCRDVRALIERGEIRLPCIIRPTEGHNSQGVFLIKEPSDTDELERFAFDGREYYISEFYECRDNDGLYRKFRVIFVNGKIYPRHLFISDNWCVDAKTKHAEEKYFNEEKFFLENFQSYLGEEVISRLNNFCAKVGLDFFGLDLNLRPDGTLVLFEANASMAVFLASNREYVEPYVNDIRIATKEMLLRFYQAVKK